MSKFLTVDRLNEREVVMEAIFKRRTHRTRYRPPTDAERLFTGRHASACLTHITRHVADHYRHNEAGSYVPHHSTPHAWCGHLTTKYDTVPVADESFACHKCITIAERHGGDTFGMIPNSGCEATGGSRWRKK